MKVKSLLAYQIFLFLIFNEDRKRLITQNDILVEYSSFSDLAQQLQDFYMTNTEHGRTSIKSALKSLEKAGVVMSTSERPTDEEVEVLGLKRKPRTFLYIDVKSLRDSNDQVFFDNNYRYKIFDKYLMPQIEELNALVVGNNVSLLAYQMALNLIFQLNVDDFTDTFETEENGMMPFIEFILKSLDDFSDCFSPFVDLGDVPQSTIKDNLDTLQNIGFVDFSWINPEDKIEYKTKSYPDQEHLIISLPLVVPSKS
jgi:DNA-binding PadR family transcriptional regulator